MTPLALMGGMRQLTSAVRGNYTSKLEPWRQGPAAGSMHKRACHGGLRCGALGKPRDLEHSRPPPRHEGTDSTTTP